MNFFPDFAPNSRKEWRLSLFNQIYENNFENCRNFWNMWKLFNFFSISFNRVLTGQPARSEARSWRGPRALSNRRRFCWNTDRRLRRCGKYWWNAEESSRKKWRTELCAAVIPRIRNLIIYGFTGFDTAESEPSKIWQDHWANFADFGQIREAPPGRRRAEAAEALTLRPPSPPTSPGGQRLWRFPGSCPAAVVLPQPRRNWTAPRLRFRLSFLTLVHKKYERVKSAYQY